jgi:hypothetical protein
MENEEYMKEGGLALERREIWVGRCCAEENGGFYLV